MLRWLLRLLILGLVAAAASRLISRMLNQEEDFEDYDDLEGGFEFTETSVEIDVAADGSVASMSPLPVQATAGGEQGIEETEGTAATEQAPEAGGEDATSILQIKGIGPTYASRLGDAGINTLDDLASADAGELADKVEVIGGRTEIEGWITQAQELTTGGAQGERNGA